MGPLTLSLSGRSREQRLPTEAFPKIPLETEDPRQLLALLEYAGCQHSLDSVTAALTSFDVGRLFAERTHFKSVSFAWDHVLSNHMVFEDLDAMLKALFSTEAPHPVISDRPLTALEAPRPFMQELVFGMMVGFAFKQGLTCFSQWASYRPQVGIATHTWPDRMAILADNFIPLLSLMEAVQPGTPGLGEQIRNGNTRAIIHLEHFLNYADGLLNRFDAAGFEPLTQRERFEVRCYLNEGSAHHCKPLGALAAQGWIVSSHLHFGDSTKVVEAFRSEWNQKRNAKQGAASVYIPNPHMPTGWNVQDFNQLLVRDLLSETMGLPPRSRDIKIQSAARNLAQSELGRLTANEGWLSPGNVTGKLLWLLSQEQSDLFIEMLQTGSLNHIVTKTGRSALTLPRALPYVLHQTPTTVGEFWGGHINPTNTRTFRISKITRRHGGLAQINQDYLRLEATERRRLMTSHRRR